MTDIDYARAREPIEYEIELRKIRGFENTPLSDKHLQTILQALDIAIADEWMAIESAAEDGSHVLVYLPDSQYKECKLKSHMIEAWYDSGYWTSTDAYYDDHWRPTHWKPLPLPPKSHIAKQQEES